MAQLDRPGKCEFAEYQRAFQERLVAGQLTDGEILTLYLRLDKRFDALKTPSQVRTVGQDLSSLAVEVTVLDEDLKPLRDVRPCPGYMVDGVWNASNDSDGFYLTAAHGARIPTNNGVFRPYDDGLNLRLFEEELVGVGARVAQDVGSFKL